MKRCTFFTGAGISAESGLNTFRDSDGLWEKHKIEDVATPDAWQKDPSLVLRFYNQRRRDCKSAMPNDAHLIIKTFEQKYDVQVITQNIDDLHERAGSQKVLHLHGEIFKMRSSIRQEFIAPILDDIQIGDLAPDGSQFRPHIVWFGEGVPMMDQAIELTTQSDIFVVIGSSLMVYPAASLLDFVPRHVPVYVIDRKIPSIAHHNLTPIESTATDGMRRLKHLLLD